VIYRCRENEIFIKKADKDLFMVVRCQFQFQLPSRKIKFLGSKAIGEHFPD